MPARVKGFVKYLEPILPRCQVSVIRRTDSASCAWGARLLTQPLQTARDRPTEGPIQESSANRPATAGAVLAERLRAAFRELHGPRLHGFALLVTLGDQSEAARLAADALAAGADHTAELSHPERAAAWLRRRVVREARHRTRGRAPLPGRRRAALDELNVDAAAFAALGALDIRQRAALVAITVERLDRRDVATIVGLDGARLEQLVSRARRRVARSGAAIVHDGHDDDGPIAARIRAIVARVIP